MLNLEKNKFHWFICTHSFVISYKMAIKNILITGGSGLIGSRLCAMLQERGYSVSLLTRHVTGSEPFPAYWWDIARAYIDPAAITSSDCIIHLAGENIGAARWTAKRKAQIRSSRTDATRLLADNIIRLRPQLQAFITASAVGYYGAVSVPRSFSEDALAGEDFLGSVCKEWEAASIEIAEHNIRTVWLRTGVVLSQSGGLLSKLAPLAKSGLLSPLGSGAQIVPWIHLDDLCRIYIAAIEQPALSGPYNAVAPEVTDFRSFIIALTAVYGRKVWLPSVPALLIKWALGQMSEMVLYGSAINVDRIRNAGFSFQYPNLNAALAGIMPHK